MIFSYTIFCVGSSPLSENLQSWTPLEMSTETVEIISKEFDIINGMKVFCKIKCTNTIGLSLAVTAYPVKVTLLPPNGKRASISVVPDGCFNNALPVVSDKKSVVLHWKGFVDHDSIQKFNFRVTSDQGTTGSWISTQERDYGYVDGLNLNDGVTYRAEVEAFNSLSNGSNVLQQIATDTRQPDITGKLAFNNTESNAVADTCCSSVSSSFKLTRLRNNALYVIGNILRYLNLYNFDQDILQSLIQVCHLLTL